MKTIKKYSSFLFLSIVLFGYGMIVGLYKLPPFETIRQAKIFVSSLYLEDSLSEVDPEKELLEVAFSDPLIEKKALLHPAVNSYQEAAIQVREEVHLLPYNEYIGAFPSIICSKIVEKKGVSFLPFSLKTYRGTGVAYKVAKSEGKARSAVLIIPGTGHNQSFQILTGEGYHGDITRNISQFSDVYILIKPNEDIRAIHDGTKKLSKHFINVHLLRHGYSYSSSYMTEALAWMKYLKEEYESTSVMGLSQGGQAALFTALEASPDLAVVASGFSVLQWDLSMADASQVHIPNLYKEFSLDKIKTRMASQKTSYLFTYGLKEGTLYEYDAKAGLSATFLAGVGRRDVICNAHPNGHIFDIPHICKLLEEHRFGF